MFSRNIFERTESAYSSVGHVNYGHLGNCLADLWINGPLGLGYRAGARLTYPARHTPLSPTSNQDSTIILASLRFSRQDGSNDMRFDPVRPTSKFAFRAYMGSTDPGDPGDLSNILHLEHLEYPRKRL